MTQTLHRFAAILSGFALAFTCLSASATDNPRVVMKTSMGSIVVELYPQQAPKSVENFLRYVKDGHYNGTIFHRVIDNFMVQGGGYDKNMRQKRTRSPIQNEAKNGLSNAPYTLAMARTPDPHSATAQFFINVKHNISLDYPGQDGWGYAVFGKVIKGMHIVDKIKQVPTARMDVPTEQVLIESVTLLK